MSKNKKQRARREAKDNQRKKAQQTIPAAANKPLPTPRPSSKVKYTTNHRPNSKSLVANSSIAKEKPAPQASQKHEIPFGVYDRILLVGEGDFSFARSLCMEHGCANVTATSFDSGEDVEIKYPQFEKIKQELEDLTPPVPIHHTIDATKLSTYKTLRPVSDSDSNVPESWDTIVFMFPHTGGLSTDVNRQVRSNQALLVGFFSSCLELKSTTTSPSTSQNQRKAKGVPFLRPGGRVIVTLFDSTPYTLWNPRDLARHTGLKVVESFKFDWSQYPGYKHVRTLGTIEGGGAWKGEERDARMFIFEKVEVEGDGNGEKVGLKMDPGRRKRRDGDGLKRGRESDEDEEDD